MNNREFGLIFLGVTVLIWLLAWSYESTMYNIVNTSCTHGPTCPMYIALDAQRNLSTTLIIILMGVSVYLILSDKIRSLLILKKIKLAVSSDERKVYDYLLKHGNQALQAELMELLNTSKVKTTRILNRLENKGLIERKRKGLSNNVVLRMKLVSK